MTGRPSEYTQEIADVICERIAEGDSLRTICLGDDMPNRATVFRWLGKYAEFSDQYARARDAQADAYADDVVYIADTEKDPQLARVRVDARKWTASKLKPKKYGDQLRTELTGESGGALQVAIFTTPKPAEVEE